MTKEEASAVAKHSLFLRLLKSSAVTQGHVLLTHATLEQIKAIAELCLNILAGNIPLEANVLEAFKRKRTLIRYLASRHVSLTQKKRQLKTKAGKAWVALFDLLPTHTWSRDVL